MWLDYLSRLVDSLLYYRHRYDVTILLCHFDLLIYAKCRQTYLTLPPMVTVVEHFATAYREMISDSSFDSLNLPMSNSIAEQPNWCQIWRLKLKKKILLEKRVLPVKLNFIFHSLAIPQKCHLSFVGKTKQQQKNSRKRFCHSGMQAWHKRNFF